MAATELSRNNATGYALFYIDSSSDIVNLPTSKEVGKEDLSTSKPCKIGSIARAMNGSSYILNGSDKWVSYSIGSGSSSGGSEPGFDLDIATEEEIDNMLNDVFS